MLKGKVLWFSQRDGNGVIKDSEGNEFYFDTSVLNNYEMPQRNDNVSFIHNDKIKECLCAKSVSLK